MFRWWSAVWQSATLKEGPITPPEPADLHAALARAALDSFPVANRLPQLSLQSIPATSACVLLFTSTLRAEWSVSGTLYGCRSFYLACIAQVHRSHE
jgi:hypothetical protein